MQRDIAPGTWRSDGDACYWTRLAGFTGEESDVIDRGFSNDPVEVEITDSDVGFKSSQGCGVWVRVG